MPTFGALFANVPLLMLLLVLGCTKSGPWRQVQTPHFDLRTDLSASEAAHAGTALEETRDALISAAWPNFPFPTGEPTVVFVLANGVDFERHFGRLIDGIFFHSSPPMAILYGSADRWELRHSAHQPTNSTLRHEMAHALAAKVYPVQPLWFAEGIAQFLEAVYYSEDGKSVVLGGVNVTAYNDYRAVRRITVRDTLKWSKSVGSLAQTDAVGLYGTSWFLFHWFYNTQPDAFGIYQDDLGRGVPSAAFEKAFPKFDADKADRDLYEYMRHGQFQDMMLPLVKPQWSEKDFKAHQLNQEEIADVKKTLEAAGRAYSKKGKKDKDEAHLAVLHL